MGKERRGALEHVRRSPPYLRAQGVHRGALHHASPCHTLIPAIERARGRCRGREGREEREEVGREEKKRVYKREKKRKNTFR